jgi:hypothetical protein
VTARPAAHGSELVELDLRDGNERVLGSGELPTISFAHREIYFVDEDHRSLWAMPLGGGARRKLGQGPEVIDMLLAGSDALHVMTGHHQRSWRQPYDGAPGGWEGPSGISILLPAADGWTLAWGPEYEAIVWPPGPAPKTAPPPMGFHNPVLTADRRSFVAWDDDFMVWRVDVKTGQSQLLAQVRDLEGVLLSLDGKTLFTEVEIDRAQRAVLTNYTDLPPL